MVRCGCTLMPHNGNNKDSMDELNKIIDRYTEGNYLIGKTAKEEMAKDILALFSVSQAESELLPDFLYRDSRGFLRIGYHGDSECEEEWKEYLQKAGNCG